MQIVDRPDQIPGHCIVNLSDSDPGGFVDTGLTPALIDPRVYVSYQALVDMGRLFGIPTREDHQRLQLHASILTQRVENLEDELRTLQRDLDAAEWTLERKFQTKPQPKPGRPRKVTANA